ncbi:MAG: hypothetical protein MI746_08065 [Pseudomonadales bacterium]|nr:hypothetical protein [Pseudomonadales bacterium]
MTTLNQQTWKLWAEVIALVSVVASLVFVGIELRLSRDIATTEEAGRANERAIAVNDLIGSNAAIWQKGCLGEELEDQEKIIFVTTLRALDSWKQFNWSGSQRGQAAPIDIARNMYFFPGFREEWRELKQLNALTYPAANEGSSVWRDVVEEQYSIIESDPPTVQYEVEFCGQ